MPMHASSFAFRSRPHTRRGAFSLLEVAFALVIFVIGALALLRIFPGGLDVLENSSNRRVAAQMSQNVLTSYTSGDLASTTPDAIFNIDQSGGSNDGQWNNYPASALGLRRHAGTVPVNPDDFSSAKDALKFVQGEKQGITQGSVYTNYPVGGRVNVFRECFVGNVAIKTNGLADFRNAVYIDDKRSDKPKLPFREPILSIDSIVGAATNTPPSIPIAIDGDAAVIQRGDMSQTYIVTFSLDPSDAAKTVDLTTASPNTLAFSDRGSGCTSTSMAAMNTRTTLVAQLTVPPKTSSTQNVVVTYGIGDITGVSNSREFYSILISSDSTSLPQPVSGPLLPIHAPLGLRQSITNQPIAFYVSYNWTTGLAGMTPNPQTQGVVNQPMSLPANDSSEAIVPFAGLNQADINNGNSIILADPEATLSFRQPLPAPAPVGDQIKFGLGTFKFNDSDGVAASASLSQVSLDYPVRSWEYLSEDISQFGTPFTGADSTNYINTNTPQGLVQFGFLGGANYSDNSKIPVSEVREVRTRVGNLRGTVQVKGFYQQSAQPLDVAFDINNPTPPMGVMSSVSPQEFVRQKKSLAKQGRLLLPANYMDTASMTILPLSHARIYYRSKDAWVQQVGVAASHYIPFMDKAIHEPWREYVQGGDGYLYFPAAEAGKIVEVVEGTNPANATPRTIEIRPDITVDNIPSNANLPADFVSSLKFTNPDDTSDPRNGKTYFARSRDTVTNNIFDVRRPVGTSGISVRTMWLNGTRYAQEVAQ